jgi:probable rRNA maturation factor
MLRVDVQAKSAGAPPAARVRGVLSRAARAAKTPESAAIGRAPRGATGRAPREVSVLFCADTRMRALNRRYRGQDRPTDVLAFPTADSESGFLGDIVISVPYAEREARRRREPGAREIDRLLVHGLLHLMGYDHETDDGEMDALEARIRRRLGLADSAESTARRVPAVRARRSR